MSVYFSAVVLIIVIVLLVLEGSFETVPSYFIFSEWSINIRRFIKYISGTN